jgi:ABC-type cobalamin transport system ATPase subunit
VAETTLPPDVEYGVRVVRLRNALDYVVTVRDSLDLLIEDIARAGLELSVVREEHRLQMLLRAVDKWLRLLEEVVGYVSKAREVLESVKE